MAQLKTDAIDENDNVSLDVEFKRYLQLLRPYLGQLVDDDVIKICDAWIQRLSNCKDSEKATRNKYIFLLCYQLTRGELDAPFLNDPPSILQSLSDDIDSDDSSTEDEYLVVNSDEPSAKVLFNSKKITSETDYLSQEDDKMWTDNGQSGRFYKQIVSCYNIPEIFRHDCKKINAEGFEVRAKNLVEKLREIKMQNMLLHKELMALKGISKSHSDLPRNYVAKVDNATSPLIHSYESSATLEFRLQDVQDARNVLTEKINDLQDQLDNFNELKRSQIEDIEAKHKLELLKVRTDAREENKLFYEKKLETLKETYKNTISKIEETAENEIKAALKSKDETILEKNNLIEEKDKEIDRLKNQLETQNVNLQSMISKLLGKSPEDTSCEGLRIKNMLLEKRLIKIEKSKSKCSKMYEAKIAQLQREKLLSECSLQLQLDRQRAQVVSEVTHENQIELTTALNKLENKYKDIVANVQVTAIQRRMQDQKALETLLQAAFGIDDFNQTQSSGPARNHNQTYDTANSSLARSNRIGNLIVDNKSYGEESLVAGFCLNGERLGELFKRVYIPQRDNAETK